MFALSRQDAEVLQETVEIDFPFTKKANYRALGACLLFTTSNKETTFDLGSSLAQTLSFLLFQFCSWINLDVERGQGHPTCPQWAAWGRWCSQHPSCPPFLINAHKGMQPAQGMKPAEGTAHCDLEISSNEHSLSLEEPLGHKGSFLVPDTALAFARACGAGLVALQHSQRQPEPSGTHPAEFRTRFWASWAGWRHLNHSANWFDQTPPFSFPCFVLTLLLSVAEFHGEKIWFVWLCFSSQQSLGADEYNTSLCGCADTHGQEPWGQMGCEDIDSLSVGRSCSGEGRVSSPASTPAAVGSWCFHPWKGQTLLTGVLGSGQHSAEPSSGPAQPCCPGEPLHSFGPPCAATARVKPHTNKINPFLWWGQ